MITTKKVSPSNWSDQVAVTFSGDDLRLVYGLVWAWNGKSVHEKGGSLRSRLTNITDYAADGGDICREFSIPPDIESV